MWTTDPEPGWQDLAEEAFTGMKAWRAEHPTVTWAEIEAALDERLAVLRGRMLQDAAQASRRFVAARVGQYPHEIITVQLPEGATVEQVLNGEVPEEEIGFFGGNFAGPGGSASFAIENLAPGSYTLVCFVDEPKGVPHVARGMVAEFTVE